MHVVVAKVDEVLYEGEAESLSVPGSAGDMTILGHHEPLITTLKAGTIVVRLPAQAGTSESTKEFAVTSGALEVGPHGATVIL